MINYRPQNLAILDVNIYLNSLIESIIKIVRLLVRKSNISKQGWPPASRK